MVIAGLSFLYMRSLDRFRAKLEQTIVQDQAIATSRRVPDAAEDVCRNLYPLFCKSRGTTRDPTGFVRRDVDGEIEALRIYEEVIHEHPDWASDQVDDELAARIYTDKRKQRLRIAHDLAVQGIERFLSSQPTTVLSREQKRKLMHIIRSARLELPPPASVYEDEPDLLTKNDVYYERLADGTRRLRVGGAFIFTVRSIFNMVFTFAHELAHAIDPCELRADGLSIEAYTPLITCFFNSRLVALGPGRQECGENDHLSETFADWLAVEVTAPLLKKYATEFDRPQLLRAALNTMRDLCEEEESLSEIARNQHPSPRIRIDGIFGAHPGVRAVLGCAEVPQPRPYCNFRWKR